ncbi:MAG: MmgE/PrpD family protein [Gemmatimonadales bacterium]
MRLSRKQFLGVAVRGAAGSAVATTLVAGDASATTGTVPDGASRTRRLASKAPAIKGATAAVRRFISTAALRDMPPEVVHQAKRCLIDGIGVILAGSTARGSAIVREYVRSVTDRKEATALGSGRLTTAVPLAALANGASGHAMDYDDSQLSTTPDRTFGLLTHPTLPPFCAALAIGERAGLSGAAFLEAFLVGFEVECKIAEAIDPNHYNHGFHSSGTIGTFGAAAAAARLLKLDDRQIGHMLAIAASMSSGIRVNFGTMTKPLHVGRACENGVVAADLASRGFTGGDDGLDGQWGFFQVFGGGADLDRLIPVLGKPYTIVSPGVAIKPYPCGSLSHPSIDAMLKLVVDHDLKPGQIRAVRLRAGSNILDPLRYKVAKTELEAKFSLPFLMSTIAIRRKAGIREFTDEFVASEPVQRMMERVTGVFDEKIEAQGFDKMRSVVEVDLMDGRTLVQPADEKYHGGPDRPFTRQELHDKFADCAQLVLPPARVQRALVQIESIDEMKDIRELVRTLTPAAVPRKG